MINNKKMMVKFSTVGDMFNGVFVWQLESASKIKKLNSNCLGFQLGIGID